MWGTQKGEGAIIMKTIFPKSLFIMLTLSLSSLTFAHGDEHHENKTWPPQPTGIDDVIDYSNEASEQSMSALGFTRMQVLDYSAKLDPRCKKALGKRYTQVAMIDKQDEKTGKVVGSTLIYFSHDKNKTVEIEFANNKVKNVKSTPARKYQPEITDEEAIQAQDLARNYFLDKGITTINELKAYSILAYKPEVGFYDTRVIYVTFHEHDDAPPQYRAWVDLTHQTIIKTGEE